VRTAIGSGASNAHRYRGAPATTGKPARCRVGLGGDARRKDEDLAVIEADPDDVLAGQVGEPGL
jgi:hypothetical protein